MSVCFLIKMRISKKEQKAYNKCIKNNLFDKEEIYCLNQWFLRNCINSEYYYLNFLLNGFLNENNFYPNNKYEQKILSDYFFGDYCNSVYHKLWTALYFLEKEINRL